MLQCVLCDPHEQPRCLATSLALMMILGIGMNATPCSLNIYLFCLLREFPSGLRGKSRRAYDARTPNQQDENHRQATPCRQRHGGVLAVVLQLSRTVAWQFMHIFSTSPSLREKRVCVADQKRRTVCCGQRIMCPMHTRLPPPSPPC